MASGGVTECPKHMTYGPCGGVGFDGTCELGDRRCTFVDAPVVGWESERSGPLSRPPFRAAAAEMAQRLAQRRFVVADFPARAMDSASIAAVGRILAGRVDAVLAGDSPRERVQFSPAYRAGLITAAGLRPWIGLNCRDRNRVALEGEMAALADAGVGAVHCVTGDHPAHGSRPDAAPVFDLDSTELAALARSYGLLTSVAESPATPPVRQRPARLQQKLRAGAEVCFVNHAGGAGPVGDFVAEMRSLGVSPPMIACVPVVISAGSAALLASFTSLVLPPGYLELVLHADDPYAAGVAAAVELSERLLALDGVDGVNLSGGGDPGAELMFAEALGEISDRLSRPGG